MKKHFLITSFTALLIVTSHAAGTANGEEVTGSLRWLSEFVEGEFDHITAVYTLVPDTENSGSGEFQKEETYSISYDFTTKRYMLNYRFIYRDKWEILTRNGETGPPEMESKYTGSRVNYWTNYKGIGEYSEIYNREIPNWFNFNRLDTLLLQVARYENTMPAISGIFWKDELKLIETSYKKARKGKSVSSIWYNFEFDQKGNIVDFSNSFYGKTNSKTNDSSNLVLISGIQLINKDGRVVNILPIANSEMETMLSGIRLSQDDKSVDIYHLEINEMFHRFAPDIFMDPFKRIEVQLAQLSKDTGVQLKRFELAEK